jgi:hypothetical protein
MVIILISACLIADPGVCRDHRLPLLGNVLLKQCAESALPHFAKWAADNPNWEIKSWRCATDEDI